MHDSFRHRGLVVLLLAGMAGAGTFALASPVQAQGAEMSKGAGGVPGVQRETPIQNPKLDRSGQKRVGTASVYARMFAGRKMADGTRMNLNDDNAASKTLPLGTAAKVTNLKTGRSATVTIQDRGPYVKGRIVDLSPSTAQQLGITPKEGTAKVEVVPIAVPPPDAGGKPGSTALTLSEDLAQRDKGPDRPRIPRP